jgi:tripartite-type tricarboxylate transporter receptor subunit TctC
MPDTREKMKNAGFGMLASSLDQFADLLKTEIVRWAKVIKEAKMSID